MPSRPHVGRNRSALLPGRDTKPGQLPDALRVVTGVSTLVWLAAMLLVLARGDRPVVPLRQVVHRGRTWALVAFLGLCVLMHHPSPESASDCGPFTLTLFMLARICCQLRPLNEPRSARAESWTSGVAKVLAHPRSQPWLCARVSSSGVYSSACSTVVSRAASGPASTRGRQQRRTWAQLGGDKLRPYRDAATCSVIPRRGRTCAARPMTYRARPRWHPAARARSLSRCGLDPPRARPW